jgi:isocitrate/isopropylmalate dehydrogenase
MTQHTIAVLPGDGIGPEVTAEAVRALVAAGEVTGHFFTLAEYAMGARAYREHGEPFPPPTRDGVSAADAVLLGAVGDPAMDKAPRRHRPGPRSSRFGSSSARTRISGRCRCIPPSPTHRRSAPSVSRVWTCSSSAS